MGQPVENGDSDWLPQSVVAHSAEFMDRDLQSVPIICGFVTNE